MEPATEVLNAKKLQELLSQIDSREKLDEDVEVSYFLFRYNKYVYYFQRRFVGISLYV